MSERGSFVTEYCNCEKCFAVLKKYLLGRDKYLCSVQIPSWCSQELPIIAGKIGGLHRGEEREVFEFDLIPKIQEEICHEVIIVVIPDDRKLTKLFNVIPRRQNEPGS